MPSNTPIPDLPAVYRVAIDYEQGGLTMTNVYHCFSEVVDADEIGASLAHSWAANVGLFISEQVNWIGWRTKELVPDSLEFQGSMSGETGGTGSAGGDPVTPGTCACVKIQSVRGGRRGRGRSFIGGIANSYEGADLASWSATLVSNLTDAFGDFRAALNTNDLPLVVFSRGSIDPPHDPMYNLASAESVSARYTSQRRRQFN